MQRFKKEQHSLRQGEARVCHYRQCPCDKNGKFAYGANGTLTQAARWRRSAIAILDDVVFCRRPADGKILIGQIRGLIDSSRRGGCRLPA